jgi:tricarballylate dehydrogenase
VSERSDGVTGGLDRLARLTWDVVVVGGGNAALVAALSASRRAERVLLLERAPRHLRGGNTRHTRDIRYAHDGGDAYTTGVYREEELLDDLRRVGRGPVNPDLARLAVAESKTLPTWMEAQGVRWQHPLRGTLNLGRTNRFFLGGGKALVNRYYLTAETSGVEVAYGAAVSDLVMNGSAVEAVVVEGAGDPVTISSRAFVVASGGFEANLDWLGRYWGEAASNFIVRGGPYNDGTVLRRLLELGAGSAGDPKGFHAVAVDARSPRFDGGIATRLDSIPFSIVVDRDGRRFADEGQDVWPKRYASWGGLIAEQPGQVAFSIYDAAVEGLFMPTVYRPLRAGSIPELARAICVDPLRLERTVVEYNAHLRPGSTFDPSRLDGSSTEGLEPPKSNWARPISRPPFAALPMRPGITFTFLGLAVDERAQVLDERGTPFHNLYAAGEVMSGNILSSGYLAGFGLTIGTVFGRIAGLGAASHGTR